MISPFVCEISAISCSQLCCFTKLEKTKTFSHILLQALANRNFIHNDGNENFHKQKLKLNYSNKTLSLPTAQRCLNFMRTGFNADCRLFKNIVFPFPL